jgi:hypothetical protein
VFKAFVSILSVFLFPGEPGAGVISIVADGLDSNLMYQEGSTVYNVETNTDAVADAGDTAFALNESGISDLNMIPKRGGYHDMTFIVLSQEKVPGYERSSHQQWQRPAGSGHVFSFAIFSYYFSGAHRI